MDWPGLMRMGLHELRLMPADFWALTPAELLVKLGLEAGQPALTRARLEDLVRTYPDRTDI
jgi:uncharacterized phage protein (TIGR02216 family)